MTNEAEEYYLCLQRSFEGFNRATDRIQAAYDVLHVKFEDINKKLENKNLELEKTIAEKEEVKNHLRNILESLTTGVVVTDLDGIITTINRCAEIFSGVSQSDAVGRHIGVLFENISPYVLTDLFHNDYWKKFRLNDRTIDIFASPVKAKNGDITGTVFVLRDITRIEKLEEIAKRKEKLSAMGGMAANIAHEIRNPLGSIELFASLLRKGLKDEKDRRMLSHIITSVKNMDNRISNVLLFAGNRNPRIARVNLHDVLKEIIFFSEQIIEEKDVALSLQYADVEPFIEGDIEMLKQVFLNIILNALQAMPDGGHLDISTVFSDHTLDIRFSDTGAGIEPENVKRIFDPFFSTRAGGSGLGLAIVHNIVDMHKGLIDVENRRGGGTVFSIVFPCENGSKVQRLKAINPEH